MKCIDQVQAADFKGKRVLVRAGLDLSLDTEGKVSDLFRVEKALPTLDYLTKAGARIVILSHIGRDPSQTNAPVAEALSKFLKITYAPDLFGHAATGALSAMRDGEIVLLENLRQHYDLEKAKDETFAKDLAALGEVYVNDAFSNSHRDHTSMTLLPKLLPHYAGFLVRDEVAHLEKALHPPRPALVMIGGTKFETKDPVIRSFINIYDHVFVVGAIANDILRVRGFSVGRSKISEHAPEKEIAMHLHIVPLTDVTAEAPDGSARVKKVDEVGESDMIVDIGPDSVAGIAPFISEAKLILWNGPTGVYERGYTAYTGQIAQMVSGAAARGAEVIIGGGDTIAAIEAARIKMDDKVFLSTGGGAMLEYLLKGTLPALDALN